MKRKIIIAGVLATAVLAAHAEQTTIFKVGITHTYDAVIHEIETDAGTVQTIEKSSFFEGSDLTVDENGNCTLTTTAVVDTKKIRHGSINMDLPTLKTMSNTFICPESIKIK